MCGSESELGANCQRSLADQVLRTHSRQELNAEILEDVPGALWTRDQLDSLRVRQPPDTLVRVVVAIDPAVSSGEDADETGIIVAGVDRAGYGYVLDDKSMRAAPHDWALRAIAAYRGHKADRIVAEVNQGGQMVEATLRMVDPTVSYQSVHAKRGKVLRAEPVSALYEQKRVRHVGAFPQLEDQMCSFTADFDRARMGFSPDRVDALVYALTQLIVEVRSPPIVAPIIVTLESRYPGY